MVTKRFECITIDSNQFKYCFFLGDKKLTYREFIDLLKSQDEEFFSVFHRALVHANLKFPAYFWNCPPVSKETLNKPFEFVVIKSEALDKITQNYQSFKEYLAKTYLTFAPAISFSNKKQGADHAILVIPDRVSKKDKTGDLDYKNLSQFTQNAPEKQKQGFWQEVANKLSEELEKGDTPRWLSTHGLGVHYLHVRIDESPKYYQFGEYKEFKKNGGDKPEQPEQNDKKISCIAKFEQVSSSTNDLIYCAFTSEDGKYKIEINDENPAINKKGSFWIAELGKPGKENIRYKISWKWTEKDKRRFEKGDFIEIEKVENDTPDSPNNENPPGNDNNNQSPNPDKNQDPPKEFKPQTDPSQIKDAKDITEAQTKAKEQITKMLQESKVKSSELDKSLWNNLENWEKYLLTLSEKDKINNFLETMKQAIKNKYDANVQKSQQPKPNQKNNGYLLPLILVGGLVFLVGVASLVIWRRKKRRRKISAKQK